VRPDPKYRSIRSTLQPPQFYQFKARGLSRAEACLAVPDLNREGNSIQ